MVSASAGLWTNGCEEDAPARARHPLPLGEVGRDGAGQRHAADQGMHGQPESRSPPRKRISRGHDSPECECMGVGTISVCVAGQHDHEDMPRGLRLGVVGGVPGQDPAARDDGTRRTVPGRKEKEAPGPTSESSAASPCGRPREHVEERGPEHAAGGEAEIT